MKENDQLKDELNQLRKKLGDLERDNRLFKETEKKLQAANQQLQASEQQLKAANQQVVASEQQLLAANQQLIANEQQLRAANQQLQANEQQLVAANNKLQASEKQQKVARQFYQNIIEGVQDGIWVTDKNDLIYFANTAMEKIAGIPREKIQGSNVLKDFLKETSGELISFYKKAKKEKKPIWYEGKVKAPAGKDTWQNGWFIPHYEKDTFKGIICTIRDVTERKQSEAELKKIEWILQPRKQKNEVRIPDYGDLTTINENRTILDSVGEEVLNGIVRDYLSLLETSAAVYEKNGDYAVGIFSSEWCRFMDCSSRALCKSKDNKKALASGKWLCHESCWSDASNQSIQTNKAVDIECSGGMHIYAIPIRANNEVIGSINFGYGNPPTDEYRLRELAAKYKVSVEKLRDLAQSYETRPAFIIDIAKDKLETSARLIGNIVEIKEMEKELLNNQMRYKKAEEIGHTGNWEYDPVSTNFWASDEAKRIYGYDLNLENFSTEMVESCIPERERVHQALIDLLEHNKKYDLIFDIITYDKGIRRTIHSIAEVERDAQGNPIKITGIINDITIQKKNEEELTKAKELAERNAVELKKAQEITHVGSWYLDTKTNEVTWTEELYKMYGFDPTKPVPPYTEHMKLFTPESWEMLSSSLEHTRKTGNPYELELRTVRGDMSNGWMWVRGEALYDENKKIVGLWGAAQDISERKNIETELQKAKEKAEESDRLKSAFLANMSHEIRTPMNGILGFTSLLQASNLTGKEQQKYIDIIQKSGDRMLNTVNDIIDISRIESGVVELSVAEVNITELLKELQSFFKPEAAKNRTQLLFKNDVGDQHFTIKTDPEKLNSILTNLIKNAIKFTSQGSIEIGYNLKKDNGNNYVEFYVKDTGIGIQKDRQTAIFNRFVQADIEDKKALQGSGLGLAISKAYAEMLGGKMWLDSEVGSGSTFYFTIKYNSESEVKSNQKTEGQILNEDNISGKLKILVAEDDETSQQLISIVVEKLAKEIILVSSGLEAVEVCRNNPDIDLVIMDIQLPDMNGYEATRKIREFNKKVIIIAQTAYALTGDREKSIEAGCNAYISKPILKNELMSLIQQCVIK